MLNLYTNYKLLYHHINKKKKPANNLIFYKKKLKYFSLKKKKLFLHETQNFYNFNNFISYFGKVMFKKNFMLYVNINEINLNFFISFINFINFIFKNRARKFYTNYSNFFFFNFFCFLYYKNPNIMLNFLFFFVKHFKYKYQKRFNTFLTSVFALIPTTLIANYGMAGCQIKIKGKYTQRPGDRRRVYYYRLGAFSISNPYNKYRIFHKQLLDSSGASGCTIIVLNL